MFSVEDIVQRINKSLDDETADKTHTLLQKPEGKFPKVLNRSAFLYHDELRKVKQAKVRFCVLNLIIPHFQTERKFCWYIKLI